MFHFSGGKQKSTLAKAGAGSARQKETIGFPDDEAAKLAETERREELSQLLQVVAEGAETDEERFRREYQSACTDQEIDRSGSELRSIQVCRVDFFDFTFANYLLAISSFRQGNRVIDGRLGQE